MKFLILFIPIIFLACTTSSPDRSATVRSNPYGLISPNGDAEIVSHEEPTLYRHIERDESGMSVLGYQYYLDSDGNRVLHGTRRQSLGYGKRQDDEYMHGRLIRSRTVDLDF